MPVDHAEGAGRGAWSSPVARTHTVRHAGGTSLPALYAATIFLSAALLFLVQPMFARMALPLLGGAPAVWNTTLVFYQVVLLVGYAYAHLTTRRLGVRRQALLHAVVLALPLLVLPIAVPGGWSPPTTGTPIGWLLGVLLVAVGPPFFAVATTSPLLQVWFARTGHPTAADPYVLYAAGNVGSMLALLAYPVLLEPHLRLATQSYLWTGGYAVLAVLMLTCAAAVWRTPRAGNPTLPAAEDATLAAAPPLSVRRRLRWVALASVPSSLLLSVTTYLTTTIAPIPLLWVLPLALYLLTFILAFARTRWVAPRLPALVLPLVLLPLAVTLLLQLAEPLWLLFGLHLAGFFGIALVCHGALAADRPPARQLTAFYLWLAVGGALGGLFTALVAPVIFTRVQEYPLVLALVCVLVRPAPAPARRWPVRLRNLAWPAALGTLVAGVLLGNPGHVLLTERSFFGAYRVTIDADDTYRILTHGRIVHGMQSTDPDRRREPLSYFTRSGPIGQVFAAVEGHAPPSHVAVIGLGTGSLACYARPGQTWTFYEIDPAVERIARDPRYFTFLQDCAPAATVVLGDARRSLATAPDGRYNLLILDAYSGDAIPVHLLTREALARYCAKLAPGGLLAFHITNGYLDFTPVLAALARDAGLVGLTEDNNIVTRAEAALGKTGSQWVVMARTAADLGVLAADPRWQPLQGRPGAAVWTDDFSSVVSVLRLRGH